MTLETTVPPIRLRFEGEAKEVLVAEWRDGHRSRFPLAYLRGWCPCAACQGHEPTHHFVEGGVATLAGLEAVGNHAVTLRWSDGHATGIFSWAFLRQACPCEACGGPLNGTPGNIFT
jgi:DUF971 family protein